MGLLSKDAILNVNDLPTEDVPVPEWGGDVRIRMLSGAERDAWETGLFRRVGKETVPNYHNLRARLVGLCAVDERGRRLFSDADLETLGQKSGAVLDRLYDRCQRLNGLRAEDVAGEKKGSTTAPALSSG